MASSNGRPASTRTPSASKYPAPTTAISTGTSRTDVASGSDGQRPAARAGDRLHAGQRAHPIAGKLEEPRRLVAVVPDEAEPNGNRRDSLGAKAGIGPARGGQVPRQQPDHDQQHQADGDLDGHERLPRVPPPAPDGPGRRTPRQCAQHARPRAGPRRHQAGRDIQRTPRRSARLPNRQAARHVLLDGSFEMEAQLLVQIVLGATPADEGPKSEPQVFQHQRPLLDRQRSADGRLSLALRHEPSIHALLSKGKGWLSRRDNADNAHRGRGSWYLSGLTWFPILEVLR